MGRWSHYDEVPYPVLPPNYDPGSSAHLRMEQDEARLPEGMTRIGYDADTQQYTFQDHDGSYWHGPAGARFGVMTRGMSSILYAGILSRLCWRTQNSSRKVRQ